LAEGWGRKSLVVTRRSALLLDLPGHLALNTTSAEVGSTAVITAIPLDVVSGPARSPEEECRHTGHETAQQGEETFRPVEAVGVLADHAGATPGAKTADLTVSTAVSDTLSPAIHLVGDQLEV